MSEQIRRAKMLRELAHERGLVMSKRRGVDVATVRDTAGETLIVGTLDEVEAWLRARATPCHGQRPGSHRPPAPAPGPWQQMIDDYLVSLTAAGQASTTIRLRREQLVKMGRELHAAGLDPLDVTGEHLVKWFGDPRHSWKTEIRRSYAGVAQRFFAWGYKTKRLPVYLGDELPKIREHRGQPRPAPDHAWQQALSAAGPRVRLMLRLAAEAGLRRGEIAQVSTRDLIEGVGGAQLLVHGKGNKERVVPISDALAAELRRGAAGHTPDAPSTGWLFPNGWGDGYLTPRYVGTLVTDALPDHWTTHTLRHRFSSRAYRATRNLRAVQKLLGHESIATTERYVAVDDSEIRAAMMGAL